MFGWIVFGVVLLYCGFVIWFTLYLKKKYKINYINKDEKN